MNKCPKRFINLLKPGPFTVAHVRDARMEIIRDSIIYKIPIQFEADKIDKLFMIRKDKHEIVIEYTMKPDYNEPLQ